MNELKYKKGLIKKKKKKNVRKNKKQKNSKLECAAHALERLLSQMGKRGVRKDLGRLRAKVKGKQKVEGIFFKGLRSDYITREALNEHNEARKNEDLHKIIDIGRDFLQKVQRPVRCTKWTTGGCPDNRKPKKNKKSTRDLREVSTEGIENLEQCSLSPIRQTLHPPRLGHLGSTPPPGPCHKARTARNQSLAESAQSEDAFDTDRRQNLEKEFEKFATDYEEAVEAQVLLRLPRGGVLEDALEALKKTGQEEEKGKFSEEETTFLGELKFAREDPQQEMPGAEEFIEDFPSPKKFPTPESHYYDTFNEKPLENLLIMTDVKAEDYNHPSWTPPFYNGEEKDTLDYLWFGKGFKTTVRDLTIVTPPIRFYRRNMF